MNNLLFIILIICFPFIVWALFYGACSLMWGGGF